MSKTRVLIHLVFVTKYRRHTLPERHKRTLLHYILGIFRNKNCHILRMNTYLNHVHILFDLHPSIAIASLVKDVKIATNLWLKSNPNFPHFESWGEGYYAMSIGPDAIDGCIKYIRTQEQHHSKSDLINEMQQLATRFNLTWHDGDFPSPPDES